MTFDPNKTISARVRSRIVKDWRSRLRDWSTIALALGAAIVAAWIAMPEDLKAHLPVDWVARVVGALNALGLAGKFVIQGPPKE